MKKKSVAGLNKRLGLPANVRARLNLPPRGFQGSEFNLILQAPTEDKLGVAVAAFEETAITLGIKDIKTLEFGPDPDGGFKAVLAGHNFNISSWHVPGTKRNVEGETWLKEYNSQKKAHKREEAVKFAKGKITERYGAKLAKYSISRRAGLAKRISKHETGLAAGAKKFLLGGIVSTTQKEAKVAKRHTTRKVVKELTVYNLSPMGERKATEGDLFLNDIKRVGKNSTAGEIAAERSERTNTTRARLSKYVNQGDLVVALAK
jgi:hypothetical protein